MSVKRRPWFAGIAAAAVVGLWLAVGVAPVAAAEPVSFGAPTASSKFGDGIDFVQPVTVTGSIERVEILLAMPGSIGPDVEPVADRPSGASAELTYHLDLSGGNTTPNTTFTARWRVVGTDGTIVVGPALRRVYADDRFDWKTLDGKVVRVHWTQGDQAFGKRALKIGDDAVAAASKLLGVTETEPIDLFVYADDQAFYDALGPATRENVGGQAHPDTRTVFALIKPGEIDAGWVEIVVPHELTHVVFQTAVDNPYHDPPHWLNEGQAVYLSAGYADSDRQQVRDAARDGTIIPLDGLAGAFPTTRDRFFLAYAESVSAVDRIVRVSGREALVKLIRSYHDGVSDDEAFQAAVGRSLADFQGDWLAELGTTAPGKTGPRPAPAGPLPEGWTGPQPNPSFEVTGSLPPPAPGAPRPGPSSPDPLARFLIPSFSVLGLVVLVVVLVVTSRRVRRNGAAAVDGPPAGWNRLYGRPTVRDEPPEGSVAWHLPRPDDDDEVGGGSEREDEPPVEPPHSQR